MSRHVECGELSAENDDHLDWHRQEPRAEAEPGSEPTTLRYNQPDLALRGTHHLADIAHRQIIVVKHRKPDQIADLDRLREAHVHFLFR